MFKKRELLARKTGEQFRTGARRMSSKLVLVNILQVFPPKYYLKNDDCIATVVELLTRRGGANAGRGKNDSLFFRGSTKIL